MFDGAEARLKEERARLSLSQKALADAVGVHKNTQMAYEGGQSPITLPYLEKVATLGVDVKYVAFGVHEGDLEQSGEGRQPGTHYGVPIHDVRVSAGTGAIALDPHNASGYWPMPIEMLEELALVPEMLRLLPVKGDSMAPTLNDGDWVMIDRSRREWTDGIYVARFYDDLFVKRVQFEGRTIRLVSDNDNYRVIEIERINEADVGAFELIGRVIWKAGAI